MSKEIVNRYLLEWLVVLMICGWLAVAGFLAYKAIDQYANGRSSDMPVAWVWFVVWLTIPIIIAFAGWYNTLPATLPR